MRAFRNLAVHKYFGVDWAVVWKIAQEEPQLLEAQVLAIIRAECPALAKTTSLGQGRLLMPSKILPEERQP